MTVPRTESKPTSPFPVEAVATWGQPIQTLRKSAVHGPAQG